MQDAELGPNYCQNYLLPIYELLELRGVER